MGTAVWKGLLRLGLLSIPVKLYRAAQAEKVSFRQVHKQTGARIRHSLCTDGPPVLPTPASRVRAVESAPALQRPTGSDTRHAAGAVADLQPGELSRGEVRKGYEYEKGGMSASAVKSSPRSSHRRLARLTSGSLCSRPRLTRCRWTARSLSCRIAVPSGLTVCCTRRSAAAACLALHRSQCTAANPSLSSDHPGTASSHKRSSIA